MKYIIYDTAAKAEIRYTQINEDATDANFITDGDTYAEIIYHPTEDKAAIPIYIIEPVYYQGIPTKGYNYEIFFTQQELARCVTELSNDWFSNPSFE